MSRGPGHVMQAVMETLDAIGLSCDELAEIIFRPWLHGLRPSVDGPSHPITGEARALVHVVGLGGLTHGDIATTEPVPCRPGHPASPNGQAAP